MRLNRASSSVKYVIQFAAVVQAGKAIGDGKRLQHLVLLLHGFVDSHNLRFISAQPVGHLIEYLCKMAEFVVSRSGEPDLKISRWQYGLLHARGALSGTTIERPIWKATAAINKNQSAHKCQKHVAQVYPGAIDRRRDRVRPEW